jgi:hypothetical protein
MPVKEPMLESSPVSTMNKHHHLWLALAACMIFDATHTQAQTGTYTTYVGGKAVVVDQYQVTSGADDAVRTEAMLGAPTGGPQQKAVTVAAHHQPVSFALSAGDKVLLAAEFKGASVTLHRAGQPDSDLQTKATVVLENLLWHQFVFLLDQYDETKGGSQSFVVFLPSQAVDYPITMERVSTPAYQVAGQTIKTRRYHAVANKVLEIEMWTDEQRLPLLFYSSAQQLKVVRAGSESLAEVAFAATPKPAAYQPPAYGVPSMFREQEVTVGAGTDWPLPATLTLPAGTGPFPALVLVHGSGPNDRDETPWPKQAFSGPCLGSCFARYRGAPLR